MARRHSDEDVTELQRDHKSADERARRTTREGDEAHGRKKRRSAAEDEDPQWRRRELAAGWREPHYEAFYDESAARERPLTGSPSAPSSAHDRPDRDELKPSPRTFWMVWGPESGKGPRSYRRSDERILDDVNERLSLHGQLDATEIEVSCQRGQVVLRGTVHDRRAKGLAEDCARSVSGVRHVWNELTLRSGRSSEESARDRSAATRTTGAEAERKQ
jgi:hypothetical protein